MTDKATQDGAVSLAPCPFCGSAPRVEPDDPVMQGNAWTRISCTMPLCPVTCEVHVNADGDHYEQAAAAWNTRAAPPVPAGSGDGWREALDGNDIWEALFGILKGDVPDALTEDVCQQLANAIALPTPEAPR